MLNAFPTISNGTAETKKYVSSLSINPDTGEITVAKGSLPSIKDVVLHAACTGSADGTNKIFKTPDKAMDGCAAAFYINGVLQTCGVDYTYDRDDVEKGVFTITEGYVPQVGDSVTCSYIKG